MTPATFIAHFPEFTETDPGLVSACLARAAARMGGPDGSVWPSFSSVAGTLSLADLAQGNLAAHYLWSSPFGAATMLAASDPKGNAAPSSPYWPVWEECCDAVAGGFIVAGGGSYAGGPGLGYGCGGAPPTSGPATGLTFTPGINPVSVVNGSTAIAFASPQTLQAGILLVFGAQVGAFYSLAVNIVGATSGVLMAPFTGPTTPASTWSHT